MELPQALELLAGCIAAGLPVRTACAAVVQSFDGPVADDLGQVLSLMDLGVAVRLGAGEVGPSNRREYLLLVIDGAALVCGHARWVVRRYKQRIDALL